MLNTTLNSPYPIKEAEAFNLNASAEQKKVTFEYCCDGYKITKNIFLKTINLKTNTECVKFGDKIITA